MPSIAHTADQKTGTAVYLHGTANCSYSVTLDSVQYPATNDTNGILFFKDGLSHTTHFVNLTASPVSGSGTQLSFDGADITDVISDKCVYLNYSRVCILTAPAMCSATGLIPVVFDNQNQTVLQYSGNWTTQNDPQIPSLNDPKPYVITKVYQGSVTANFSGAVAVAINANRNFGHWLYNVVRGLLYCQLSGSLSIKSR